MPPPPGPGTTWIEPEDQNSGTGAGGDEVRGRNTPAPSDLQDCSGGGGEGNKAWLSRRRAVHCAGQRLVQSVTEQTGAYACWAQRSISANSSRDRSHPACR